MAQHISTNDLRVYLGGRLTEPWSSSSITGLITKDFLENVKKQFALLDSTTKIRVLFAFLGLSKNALKDLEVPILEICDLCQQQSFGEEWLVFMGQFIRSFVSTDDQRAVVLFHEMLQNEQFAAIYQSLKAKRALIQILPHTFWNLHWLNIGEFFFVVSSRHRRNELLPTGKRIFRSKALTTKCCG
jgi:hypothetical protein